MSVYITKLENNVLLCATENEARDLTKLYPSIQFTEFGVSTLENKEKCKTISTYTIQIKEFDILIDSIGSDLELKWVPYLKQLCTDANDVSYQEITRLVLCIRETVKVYTDKYGYDSNAELVAFVLVGGLVGLDDSCDTFELKLLHEVRTMDDPSTHPFIEMINGSPSLKYYTFNRKPWKFVNISKDKYTILQERILPIVLDVCPHKIATPTRPLSYNIPKYTKGDLGYINAMIFNNQFSDDEVIVKLINYIDRLETNILPNEILLNLVHNRPRVLIPIVDVIDIELSIAIESKNIEVFCAYVKRWHPDLNDTMFALIRYSYVLLPKLPKYIDCLSEAKYNLSLIDGKHILAMCRRAITVLPSLISNGLDPLQLYTINDERMNLRQMAIKYNIPGMVEILDNQP
jgi:hypothetical protein